MRRRLAAAMGAAGVLAGGALAAATPLSPQSGTSSLHPVFTWSLPANERSLGLLVADGPDLGPDGRFPDEDVVVSTGFANDERRWTPSSPLYAGRYWWLVWSSDRTTSQSYYSAPAGFTVPVSLTLLPVKTVRSTFLHLLVLRVRWTANTHALTVRARVLKGKRVVWQSTQPQVNKIGFSYSTSFGWYKPRSIKRGSRLRLVVTLRAQGAHTARTLA